MLGRSNRRYTDEEDVANAAKAAGYTDIFKSTLIGITEMEKLMGKRSLQRFSAPLYISPKARSRWCRNQIKEKQSVYQPQKRILRRTK